MVVTRAQAKRAIMENGERFNLSDADFNSGNDDTDSLSTGEVGEIGEAEVGTDGQLADYTAVMLGAPPRTAGGSQVVGNEYRVNLGGTTENDTTQIAFGVRRQGDPGFTKENNASGWEYQRLTDNTNPSEQPKAFPGRPIARDGRLVIFAVKDESTAPQVDISATSIEYPAVGGDI